MSAFHDRSDARDSGPAGARSMTPEVDAAIERLIASMPLRRPSALFERRMSALLERPAVPAWHRLAPLAAALLLLGVGFIAGAWVSSIRLGGGSASGSADGGSTASLQLVHRDSSRLPAVWGEPRTLDLGRDGAVQTAPSIWIRTDRFHDPQRGVTIERTYPEAVTLVGAPAAD